METTKVFKELLAAYVDPDVRIIALKGSTRSGKTWAVLQLLNLIAMKSTVPRLISVVSESMPHLRKGCIRDFKGMLEKEGLYDWNSWRDTDKTYSYGKGKIEFFSVDQPGKVLGPARNVLFINECIRVSFSVFQQLAVRTTEKIILDYNPANMFWLDEKVLPRADARLLRSTYLDNDCLTPGQIAEIESNRDIDPEWWKVYGLGETGSGEGLIITNWDIVRSMPEHFKEEYIGLDFGYNVPSAAEHIRLSGGEVYIDEIFYEKKLDNVQIADLIKDSGLAGLTIVADSAEPKSIEELKSQGLTVVEADKGPDSIRLGIQIMNRYKKHYTERSLGSIDENRKYSYLPNKIDGGYTCIPKKAHNHAKDAERYVFLKYFREAASQFDFSLM